MKFEAPVVEIKMFNLVDVLTTSGDPGVADGVGGEGGTCIGTMADYWENNCAPY